MAIGSVNYSSPVSVNGYSCINCSEVALATKNIDPAHPRSGPNNVDAAKDPTRTTADPARVAAAKRLADSPAANVTGYAKGGARIAIIPPGSAFSLAA